MKIFAVIMQQILDIFKTYYYYYLGDALSAYSSGFGSLESVNFSRERFPIIPKAVL